MQKFEKITSRENPNIKLTVSLLSGSKKRKESGLFVLEGLRLCQDAANEKYPVELFFISESAFSRYNDKAEEFAAISARSFILPDNLFSKISDTVNPQGFLFVCKTTEKLTALSKKGKYIALENLSDPSNIGAVARTAEALGFDGIVITNDCCDPFSPKSLRASMGALLRIPVMTADSLIETAKRFEITTYSAVVHTKANPINQVDFKEGSMLIIGNEANGIKKETVEASSMLITIPMEGRAESLNAATAASIIMWEMCRRI